MGSTSTEGTADCVVIDLEPKARAESLRQQAEAATSHQKDGRVAGPCTIFRVPTIFRAAHSDDYQPKFISLGPYHWNEPKLKAINHPHKLRYLQKILDRNDNAKLEHYLSVIEGLEARARGSYSEEIDMESGDFVEMMLLDACFIVELLLMHSDGNTGQTTEMEEDPIHSSKWILPQIRYDMLILENQIPIFILQSVFDLATRSAAPNQISLITHIILYMGHLFPGWNEDLPLRQWWESSPPQVHHILHLVHSYILHSSTLVMSESNLSLEQRNQPFHKFYDARFPCATKLRDAGVVFKGKSAKSFLDVTFENGVVGIPTLDIYNHMPSLFRNLVAFEVCFGKSGMYITAYAQFMDSLIDTSNDIALLHERNCILNALGNDDAPAVLFNELGDIGYDMVDSFYLRELYINLNRHYKLRWNRWRAILKHDYLTSPWAIISIVAALIVIFLTFIQTLYAPLSYYNPHN